MVFDFIQIMSNKWANCIVFLSFYIVDFEQKVVEKLRETFYDIWLQKR